MSAAGDGSASPLARLSVPELPAYRLPVARATSPQDLIDARDNVFRVARERVQLAPPIDWLQDPYGSRSWMYDLHTLAFVEPLLRLYRDDGDVGCLRTAVEIALDWWKASGPDAEDVSPLAWYDMAVGLRAPLLAWLAIAAHHEGQLTDSESAQLARCLAAHGSFLADDKNYAFGHNHGLFQDEGLMLLADYLPVLEGAAGWRATACRRLLKTLRMTVNFQEGVHLEHSPAYHYAIVNMTRRLLAHFPDLSQDLGPLLARLEATGRWFVMPDGTTPQFGDTDRIPAPRWAAAPGSEAVGMKLFLASGYAVVRTPSCYLAVAAGYHGHGHKHADELSFVLHDGGHLLVGDAGRYGYDEEHPDRRYARSSAAHNVLVVDHRSFGWRGRPPYGSGIRRGGEGDGWYGVEATNPLVGQGTRHRRVFLYRPGHALIVVDVVSAEDDHDYSRLFHLGPGIHAIRRDDMLELRGLDVPVAVSQYSESAVLTRLVGGQDEPSLQGWTYPSERTREPVTTVVHEYRARDLLAGSLFAIGAGPARLASVSAGGGSLAVTIEGSEGASTVRCRRRGCQLLIEQSPPDAAR